MTEKYEFIGNKYRPPAPLNRWISRARREQALEPDLPIIDSHHHLWDDDRGTYLLPDMLADINGGHNIRATVCAECHATYRADGPEALRPLGEVEFFNGIAAMSASGGYGPCRVAAGIIGHADLGLGEKVQDLLDAEMALTGGRLRGIRYSISFDPYGDVNKYFPHSVPPGRTAVAAWRAGYSRLAKCGLVYDVWCYYLQIPELTALARAFPDTTLVLDHVGGPLGVRYYADRKAAVFEEWKRSLSELATCPNVVVKLGGLGMLLFGFDLHLDALPPSSELLAEAWKPFIETCIEAFGVDRCMYQSNFPNDKQTCDYNACWNAFKRISAGASATEKTALFSGTAARVYRLDMP